MEKFIVDRANNLRTNITYLENAFRNDSTKILLFKNFLPLAVKRDGRREICVVTVKEVCECLSSIDLRKQWPETLVFLGIEKRNVDDVAWFAYQIDHTQEEIVCSKLEGCYFLADRWKLISLLHEHERVVCQAKSMLHWLDRYRYCATCGGSMKVEEAGYKRTCEIESCRSNAGVHNTCYPRTDPTVIMCITSSDNTKCLLGRKPMFPKKMYSCLAGFLEPGETIEDAVLRETKEESGIDIGEVKYLASQAWPFPSSLMIGCLAVATSHEIIVCPEEMEDVKWFDCDTIRQAISGDTSKLVLPPKQAIARQLIETWVERSSSVKSVL